MESQTTQFTPEWARSSVMTAVLRMYQDPHGDVVSQSDLFAECASGVPAFDDLPEETQDLIFDLILEAVWQLVEDGILLLEETIFEINPNAPDLLIRKGEMDILPEWGSA